MGKLLFVNLSENKVEVRLLSEDDARNFMGGPSLGAKILYDNMPANADPFGPDSMVGFVTGPLSGTKALFSGRYTVVSKSPVTGGWNDANSGGSFGPKLKKTGFDAVFVNGIADKPVYILIEEGEVKILDASEFWGLTTLQTEAALKAIHGDKINIALIGPAGEKLSLMSAVMNDGHRAAGRGGTGAVLGSKNLKAIVVKGNLSVEVFDDAQVLENNKAIVAFMKGPGKMMADGFGTLGTGMMYDMSTQSGDSGIKNWSGSGVVDYPSDVAAPVGSVGLEQFKKAAYHCANCPLGCGAFLDVPTDRDYDLSHSPRPEYETMGTFGSMLLNNSPDVVCICNDICNDYGLDTISAGSTVAWAMECYNNGILSIDELDGINLTWGNGDAIIAITNALARSEGVGAILAKGSKGAADYFGKGHEFLAVASGIEEPQHDSRLAYGLTRTYQYDPTPGRHVKGGIGMGVLVPKDRNIDYVSTGYADLKGVIDTEITNSSGSCLFGSMCSPPGMIMKQVMAVTGINYTNADINAVGIRMFNMRQIFNVREGLRRKDFTLSRKLHDSGESLTGPLAGIKIDHERLADNFFNAIGWTSEGVPMRESLLDLGGFETIVTELYPAPSYGPPM
jgi:aldehyde:ferredoxin oxidoreductase